MIIGISGVNSDPGVGSSYTTIEVSYTIDENNVYTIDQGTLIGTDPNTYEINRFYATRMRILASPLLPIDSDFLSLKHVAHQYTMDTTFLLPIQHYDMGIFVILAAASRLPADSVINSLIWSWATVLDQSYRAIKNATNDLTLPNATGTTLDEIGEVYHTKRLLGETDTNYRSRLMIKTSVILAFGTKASCENIIDTINEYAGCNIKTGYPGNAKITFDNDESMRRASANRTRLETIIPDMLAAGVSWKLYTPILDYHVKVPVLGPVDCPYTMSELNQMFYDFEYTMSILEVFLQTAPLPMDILSKKIFEKAYSADQYTMKRCNKSYTFREYVSKLREKAFDVDMLWKFKINLSTLFDILLLNRYAKSTYTMDTLSSITSNFEYDQYLYTIKRIDTAYVFDLIIMNLIAEYLMDYKTMITHSESYRTRLSVVAA